MSKLHLWPTVIVVGKDFTKSKVSTVPNQSLSLREIIKRFLRKESLPIEKEGFYADDLGDIEKIAREDITERHERAATLKRSIRESKERKEKWDADRAAEAAAAALAFRNSSLADKPLPASSPAPPA